MIGFFKGAAIVLGGFLVGFGVVFVAGMMLLVTRCAHAQSMDVRINTNNRTIQGLPWPPHTTPNYTDQIMGTELSEELARIDMEYNFEILAIDLKSVSKYNACLTYNMELHRQDSNAQLQDCGSIVK